MVKSVPMNMKNKYVLAFVVFVLALSLLFAFSIIVWPHIALVPSPKLKQPDELDEGDPSPRYNRPA